MIDKLSYIGGGKQKPTMVVVHSMGQYIEIEKEEHDWFKKYKNVNIPIGIYHAEEWLKMRGLSAHFLIDEDKIIKLRSTKKIAYHARGFNTNSVGIEVLVKGVWKYGSFIKKIKEDWVLPKQYIMLTEISKSVIDYWEMKKIVRHSDISPGRKVDPGSGFKWNEFKKGLK